MKLLICILLLIALFPAFGKEYKLTSPDKKTEVNIEVGSGIQLKVSYLTNDLFTANNISVDVDGKPFPSEVKRAKTEFVSELIHPEIKQKFGSINDEYNSLNIDFKNKYSLNIRAYNNGVAYRFKTSFKDSLVVQKENLDIHFEDSDSIILQKSNSFHSSYETPYKNQAVKDVTNKGYGCLPALVKKDNGVNILVCESGLEDYPGLWLKGTGTNTLSSALPGYPLELKYPERIYNHGQVKKHAGYIAKTSGNRSFPWRIFAISETDAGLISNNLVYQLAKPCQIEDISWIKPGVVTFDWWGKHGIYSTDFKSGVNTETAKYFIDFAAEFGFEYFLFDDGWSELDDLFAINPELDMEEVLAYAKKKDVKIMLWAIWNTFLRQEEKAWEQFEKWGIAGIKFDFMNRDDQKMVKFYHDIACEAAKRKMVINFHGAYKPAGLRRTYPNVLTREGLINFEYNGWTKYDTPGYHNLLPYIRMVAGPADYIPFTTRNAQKKYYRPTSGGMLMSMGTRAHSMALYVILKSPMQMLPDSPSDYYRERECTEFISKIPVEWDDLKVLHAKLGKYTVLARKHGDDWYIGAITDWNPRDFYISFDFLGEGEYQLEYITDGINADKRANDYILKSQKVLKGDSVKIELAPAGGWLARIIKL